MNTLSNVEHLHTVVVGGGQSGLSVGYFLRRHGVPFTILESDDRVGDVWRRRWDSLRLFTPAKFDGLAGLRFPAAPNAFPTKDEMADYLERYAGHFDLPVRTGMRVDRVSRNGRGFRVESGNRTIHADHVVVAMATFQRPRVPAFSGALAPDIVQLHSRDYRNPGQLQPGGVLVVGAGNSGAEIALEVSRHHPTWLSGRDTGQIPFRVDGPAGRALLVRLVLRGVFHRVLTVNTPVGRRARPGILAKGGPLIRTKSAHLQTAGVERVARVAGVRDGRPVLDDGTTPDVRNVVWCTGYHPGFSWLDLPVFGEDGEPRHASGMATDVPGLYFVGLHFLHALSSTMIHGVARDAARVAGAIAHGSARAA